MNTPFAQLAMTLLCYVLFFLTLRKASKKSSGKLFVRRNKVADVSIVNELQIAGLLLLGVFTALVHTRGQMKFLSFPKETVHYVITGLLAVAVFIISWMAAGSKFRLWNSLSFPLNNKPQTAATYFLLRMGFIVAYEFFLRGALLFDVAIIAGIIVSAIVNVVLYVLLHFFDDRHEIIGAIPFGIVLCWITWQTQSIWPAVILHVVLALTSEIRIFCHHFHSPKKMII